MHKKVVISIVVFILLIGLGVGYYFYTPKIDNNNQAELININPDELLVFEVKNENLSEYQKNKAFDIFNEAKNKLDSNIKDGIALDDDANYYVWLDIARAQKIIGDYERVEKLWLWFTEAYPGNSVSSANLADLYKSFLKDKEKSEKYYLITLEREKKKFQFYLGLFELYKYDFNDPDKAIQVLKDGMENNPDNKNFVTELANYLISLDRKNDAEEVINIWVEDHPQDFGLKAILN